MTENSHDTTGHSGERTDCHLCNAKNEALANPVPVHWTAVFIPLSSKNPSGKTRSTVTRLELGRRDAAASEYALTYRTRATLTNYMRMRKKTNMTEFVYW